MDQITLYIAAYGAIVASLSFILSLVIGIHELRKSRPKIKVSLTVSRLLSPSQELSEPLIGVKIINEGAEKVIFDSCGWLKKDKSKDALISLYRIELPYALEPGSAFSIFLPIREFKKHLRSYKAFFIQSVIGESWKRKLSNKQIKVYEEAEAKGWKLLWDAKQKKYFEEYTTGSLFALHE